MDGSNPLPNINPILCQPRPSLNAAVVKPNAHAGQQLHMLRGEHDEELPID